MADKTPKAAPREKTARGGALLSFLLDRRNAEREPTRGDLRRRETVRRRTARLQALRRRSLLFRLFDFGRAALFMTDLRAFSLLLFPPGLAALFRCLVLPAFTDDFPLLPMDGAAGIVWLLAALILLPMNARVHRAAKQGGFFSRLLFDALALPRPYPTDSRGIPALLFLPVGLGLAVLTVYVSPFVILLLMLALAFVLLSLSSPEFSLILTAVLFPFLPLLPYSTVLLTAAVALGGISYLFKLLLGKRAFVLRPMGLTVLLFSLTIALFALLSPSGSEGTLDGLMTAVLILGGYFLAANLLATRRTLLLFIRGLLFSVALLSALSITEWVMLLAAPALADSEPMRLVADMLAVLGGPKALAAFLLSAVPLLLTAVNEQERAAWRYTPSLLLVFGALILSFDAAVYAVLVLSLILFALLEARRWAGRYLITVFLLFGVVLLLPEAAHTALVELAAPISETAGAVLSEHLALLRGARALFFDHPFGVGFGYDDGLAAFLAEYGLTAADAGSLYLHVTAQLGIFGLLLLFLLVLYFSRALYSVRHLGRENAYRRLFIGGATALSALLLFGFAAALIDSRSVTYLLFLLLGFLSATERCAHEDAAARHLTRGPAESTTAAAEVRLDRGERR
ncbi:MAG: hypothetical protein IJF73_05385 [Clostridia bacterium]|nr:hypothetical protein [Clostridia bacterium]